MHERRHKPSNGVVDHREVQPAQPGHSHTLDARRQWRERSGNGCGGDSKRQVHTFAQNKQHNS
eukprot:11221071-Lingulodinium_polyedra.AAC.1